jgi:hypothetical protein
LLRLRNRVEAVVDDLVEVALAMRVTFMNPSKS